MEDARIGATSDGRVGARSSLGGLLGSSPAMQRLYGEVERAAATDSTVFISGESGTGKELVAAAIHDLGARRAGPLVRVNVSALHASLFESELFGHARGAFTGAVRERTGRFEAAHRGTIFLDEIGDLPAAAQVKLLRVLQERRIERVGETESNPVDVRVISATHKQLDALVRAGDFRADLYYRLHVLPIRVPSLRERLEDAPLLATAVLARLRARYARGPAALAPDAAAVLTRYDWPGNVRELENAIEYAFVRARADAVTAEDLPEEVLRGAPTLAAEPPSRTTTTGDVDDAAILQALRDSGGRRTVVARRLGISRTTLWRRLKRLEREAA